MRIHDLLLQGAPKAFDEQATKTEQLLKLPLKLSNLCWSCVTPDWTKAAEPKACGKCPSCTKGDVSIQEPDIIDIIPQKPQNKSFEIKGSRITVAQKKTTLVMLSGGIDSVYVLEKLLRESDDNIIAHHVHMVNDERRFKVEAQRCAEIVKWCRTNIRDFGYSESAVDHRGMFSMGYDILAIGFEAGIVTRSFTKKYDIPLDRWTSGWCAEEAAVPGRAPHIEALCAAAADPSPAPEYFHLPVIPKGDQMRYMTPDLLNLCWTCRRPHWRDDGGFDECGECHTCTLMEMVREAV